MGNEIINDERSEEITKEEITDEEIIAVRRAYQRAYQREWRKKHPDRVRENARRFYERKARKARELAKAGGGSNGD